MRVVLVTGIFPPDIGGPATHTDDLRAELRERGHEVTVIALWDGPCVSRRPGLIRIPRRWTWPVRLSTVAWWLARHRRDYDAVYATGLYPSAVAGAQVGRRPVVVKVVGDPVWERGRRQGLTGEAFTAFQGRRPVGGRLGAMRWLRDASLRRATAITAPSAYLADVVEGWLGGPAAVTVIPNGVRIAEGSTPELPGTADGLRVVFVGRLVAHKRVERLIAAVAATDAVTLEVIGDGPERDALVEEAARREVADRVRFSGDLPHTRVLRLVGSADALVLASDYEGLPHVVLEALAAGTPVISPAVGGVGEVLTDGESGLILADAEVTTIAAAFARLRDDGALRARLSDGAGAAGATWTMTTTAERVEELLRGARRPQPRVIFLGSTRWELPLGVTARRRAEVLVRHARPMIVGRGRAGVRWAGRVHLVTLPDLPLLGPALSYGVAPLAAVGGAGRHGAIVCQSPFEGVVATGAASMLPRSWAPRIVVEVHGDWRTAAKGYGGGSFGGLGGLRARLGPFADRAARWALRRADAVRVVSSFTEQLVREAGVRGPVERYTAFTDTEPLLGQAPAALPVAPRALYVGALESTKGIDVLVDAWRDVRDRVPDAVLTVVGEGSMRDRVAGPGIEVRGHVPAPEVARELDDARFLVVPSRSEGLGRVVLEAFARGRAVIGSNVGGIPELVTDGETGYLVPPGDPAALADALLRAFADPASIEAMGERARAVAVERDPSLGFEAGIARLAAWVAG